MPVTKIVSRLSSTRDLRAEIVALATKLVGNREKARLILQEPVISRATIDAEWQLLQPILNQDVVERLKIETPDAPKRFKIETAIVLVDKSNWRFEVVRQLLCAACDGAGPRPPHPRCDRIGASQTPIRSALRELTLAGLVHAQRRGGFMVKAQELTPESLGKAGALPQTLRFRFERGAIIKSPAQLLTRLSQPIGDIPSNDLVPNDWITCSLSGTPVAQHDQSAFDLLGVPRLDLVVRVPRKAKAYDADLIRMLDDGLELEPSVTAHTPVVMTLVRADTVDVRRTGLGVATAHPADVYLSLHDMGMRAQAFAYAEAMLP